MTIPAVEVAGAVAEIEAGALLLDVREQNEWDAGHAPAAQHLPMGLLQTEWTSLPRDRRIVVVCRSGRRSAAVTEALVGAGLDAVNLAGGMQAWHAAGQPLVADGRAHPAVI